MGPTGGGASAGSPCWIAHPLSKVCALTSAGFVLSFCDISRDRCFLRGGVAHVSRHRRNSVGRANVMASK